MTHSFPTRRSSDRTARELVAAEHGDQLVVVHVSAHVHVFEIGRKRGGALGRRGSREGRLRLRRGCRRVIAVLRMGIVLCGGRQGGAGGTSRPHGEGTRPHPTRTTGRESCRQRVCPHVSISAVAQSPHNTTHQPTT